MQSLQVAIGDARVAVRDQGHGHAIVLLHGLLLASETWDAQAAALARAARVVRIDFRGHGVSSVPAGPYLMETLAGDVAGVLDALGIERATIVGHSLGGYVTFAFFRMFAERCAALGFVCTRAAADDDAAAAARNEVADRVEREGIAPARDVFAGRQFAPQTYRERPDLEAHLNETVNRTDPLGAAAMLRGIAARVASDDLFEEIHVPVRIVAGKDDAIIPPAFSETMARGIRGAELDVLACGHVPLYECPHELTASLERLAAAATASRS